MTLRPLRASDAIEHLTYSTQGIHLHVAAAGPKDGPLLVLLHGFPEFWYSWRKQIQHFASLGYRVLAPDQRGYNLSDKPSAVSAYRLDRLGGDIVGLVEAAGRGTAFVAGHDWGAAVTWWLAANHAEKFPRTAVLNVPHPAVMARQLVTDPRQLARSWYMFFFQVPRLPEAWFSRNDFAVGCRSLRGSSRRGTFGDEDLALYKEAWGRPGAVRSMISWYRANLRSAPSFARTRVKNPMLILWGEKDLFLRKEMAKESLKLCDQGSLETFPELTHWIQHEDPARVNAALEKHFGTP